MITVKHYNVADKQLWDSFIDGSKNGTFMLKRDYVEYHSDRFQDYSLMFFDDNSLVAVLPASLHANEVRSHGGLTYGGIICNKKMTAQKMLVVFDSLIDFLRGEQKSTLIYKRVPSVYFTYPSDEDLYALFRVNAELFRRDISTAIYLPEKIRFNERRRRNIKKAIKANLEFKETDDYRGYVDMLSEVLKIQHGVKPVHSCAEIEHLVSCFPDNIKLYAAYDGEKMLAGSLLFLTDKVVHAQYIANSQDGKSCGALDFVFDNLINDVFNDKTYFDFGISTEDGGRVLNEGLIEQKQEFGGRAIIYDFYRINIF